jgi:hypothetical protein
MRSAGRAASEMSSVGVAGREAARARLARAEAGCVAEGASDATEGASEGASECASASGSGKRESRPSEEPSDEGAKESGLLKPAVGVAAPREGAGNLVRGLARRACCPRGMLSASEAASGSGTEVCAAQSDCPGNHCICATGSATGSSHLRLSLSLAWSHRYTCTLRRREDTARYRCDACVRGEEAGAAGDATSIKDESGVCSDEREMWYALPPQSTSSTVRRLG